MDKQQRNSKLARSLILAGLSEKLICKAAGLSNYEFNLIQRELREELLHVA